MGWTSEIQDALAAPFPDDEIDFIPRATANGRALAVPYIDTRSVMRRLDAVVGPEGWQFDFEMLSPDGKKLAYLTGALVEPSPIGRAGGLAAPAFPQQRTLQVTWHVIDLEHDRTIDLTTFEPTDSFIYLIQYFDQFAQSVAVWSPDSRALVYTGQPLIGQRGVYVIDAQDDSAKPRFVGPGDFAIWSWR